ncbi:MAG: hypothetical protein MK035_05080 [Dehalococcoidia bacterium]|nr:hypothetical protein [Dehalococcoidia bacterium]
MVSIRSFLLRFILIPGFSILTLTACGDSGIGKMTVARGAHAASRLRNG